MRDAAINAGWNGSNCVINFHIWDGFTENFCSDGSFTGRAVGDFYCTYMGSATYGWLNIYSPRFERAYWCLRVWDSVPEKAQLWIQNGLTASTGVAVNSTYCSGGISYRSISVGASGVRIVHLTYDVTLNSTYSSDGVAKLSANNACPSPVTGGTIFVSAAGGRTDTSLQPRVNLDGGTLQPWYCGQVAGHWYGSCVYLASV